MLDWWNSNILLEVFYRSKLFPFCSTSKLFEVFHPFLNAVKLISDEKLKRSRSRPQLQNKVQKKLSEIPIYGQTKNLYLMHYRARVSFNADSSSKQLINKWLDVRLLEYNRGGQTFFLMGQISLKYCIVGRKFFFLIFLTQR